MEDKSVAIMQINESFQQAYQIVKKMKNSTDDYLSIIEKVYDSCNLFFIKNYLEMFKSEANDKCIITKLEKLKILWEYANRVFYEYSEDEEI